MTAPHREPISPSAALWTMPLTPDRYDRRLLSPDERTAVAILGTTLPRKGRSKSARRARVAAARLIRPLADVWALRHPGRTDKSSERTTMVHLMFCQMHRRGTTFWEWTAEEWCEVLCASADDFLATLGMKREYSIRPSLLDVAYLLCHFDRFSALGPAIDVVPLARVVFGTDMIARQCARLAEAVEGLGYGAGHTTQQEMQRALCLALLLNRHPHIELLTRDRIAAAAQCVDDTHPAGAKLAQVLRNKLQIALVHSGILPAAESPPLRVPPAPDKAGVPDEWYAWCMAWHETARGTLVRSVSRAYLCHILAAGRWLALHHPDVVSPAQWTEHLALSYRAALFEEKIGDYASQQGRQILARQGLIGKPLSYATIGSKLVALRRFFDDVQDAPHAVGGTARKIPLAFKPRDTFAIPKTVRDALDDADPRDIDLAVWRRLAAQAAQLTAEDLPCGSRLWPLAAVRAMALLWVSTARRPNELLRLRVDCFRREWDGGMLDEADDQLDKGEDIVLGAAGTKVCYLRIPSGKNGNEFWIWIPKYTADAIDAWKAERGAAHDALFDEKDREFVDLLFCQRGRRMSQRFLNKSLIPLLCRKAGVDPFDAKGAYTGHRGRSSRISMLRACGMELDDLAEYAGHTGTRTIRRYARTNPIHLHRKVAHADVLSTIIEGLYDPQAAQQGEPAMHWFLGYDVEAAPQFCALPAHWTCPHRMDCPHCGLYIGGEKAQLIHDDPQQQLVTSEIATAPAAHLYNAAELAATDDRLTRLARIPPPAPPSAAYLMNPQGLTDAQLAALAQADTEDARQQLMMVIASLRASVAQADGKDGRNVVVATLKKRLALVERLLAQCEAHPARPVV